MLAPVGYTQIIELTERTAKQWHVLASDEVRGLKETSACESRSDGRRFHR